MDGVCRWQEIYFRYKAKLNDPCQALTILAAEDEVVQVLSLSGLPLETLGKVWDSTSGAFVNSDAENGLNRPMGADVRWEKFIVLLSVSHQSSGLDLESYLRKFRKPPSQIAPIPKGPNLSLHNDMQAVVKQLSQTAIKDEKVQKHRTLGTPYRHRKQHSAPISTMVEAQIVQEPANAESSLRKGSGPAVGNSLNHNYPKRPPPVPGKPVKIAGAPPVPRKPAKLATFPPVPRNWDTTVGHQPVNRIRTSESDVADGFQEYSENFVRPPPIPLSLQAGRDPNTQNISSSDQGELPSSPEKSPRVATPAHSGSDDELYLDEPRRPAGHNILDISELSDFVPPLLSEPFQPRVRNSISDITQQSVDPENAPIPLSALQSPSLATRHSKYWEPAAVSIPPLSYDVPGIPQDNIGQESLPIITAETRQIARNRLIALKDQNSSSKAHINRRKSVLGFKKIVEAEFSIYSCRRT